RTTADLEDLPVRELHVLLTVPFLERREADRTDRQIQSHRDRIGAHEHLRLARAEAPRFLATDFRREVAVDHGDAMLRLQLLLEREDIAPCERDDGSARLDVIECGWM